MLQGVVDEDDISSCLQLAMLLEASAHPKPGNVHRTRDFLETRFEHFLASAAALGPIYRRAARRGFMISRGVVGLSHAQVGKAIQAGVEEMLRWQKGGNTSLGVILLLVPIAASAGMTIGNGPVDLKRLRSNLRKLLRSATYVDSLYVYRAISKASPGGIGIHKTLDVMSPESTDRIKKKRTALLKIFEMSARHDSIASEWVSGFKITFDIGYPYFADCIKSGLDINTSTVNTFLKILSTVPDTLITRKVGIEKSRYVSVRARECLETGGVKTPEGLSLAKRLDQDLRTPSHELNPGTTADILSAVLAVALLQGFRP